MSLKHLLHAGAGVLLLGSVLIAAPTDKPDAPPATPPPATETKPTRTSEHLVKPWSDIKSLSEDQITKLKTVHEKALAEMNEIKAKEKAESMAILTDPQKVELKEAVTRDRKEAAVRRAEKLVANPATKPSADATKPAPDKKP